MAAATLLLHYYYYYTLLLLLCFIFYSISYVNISAFLSDCFLIKRIYIYIYIKHLFHAANERYIVGEDAIYEMFS